tara:strand:- start:4226 stop:4507 length:282 start_codon:yes stop_codon:yes gene_type:complete
MIKTLERLKEDLNKIIHMNSPATVEKFSHDIARAYMNAAYLNADDTVYVDEDDWVNIMEKFAMIPYDMRERVMQGFFEIVSSIHTVPDTERGV